MPPILDIDHLTCRFADGTVALTDIHLSIDAGSFTVIAGANGSGKTTLLRHLNGLIRPSAGEVRLGSVPVFDDLAGARRRVGMVFQDTECQIVGETVAEDVAFGPENLKLSRAEIDRRVDAALAAVGLERLRGQGTHALSGGEKRRLAIAGVLAMSPEVLVFDEPFANLDHNGVCQVRDRIVDLHRSGHTIVITSHNLEKILSHADRLILMAAGRVVRDGPPMETIRDAERFGVRPPCLACMGLEATS